MYTWIAIGREPWDQPYGSSDPRDDEGGAPSRCQRDCGYDERCDYGADVGAGVENPDCERPLLLRKPLRHGLQARREAAGLTQPQREAHQGKLGYGVNETVADVRQCPDREGHRIAG